MSNTVKLKSKARWLHVARVDWFRKFTFKERVKIFFGCNLNVLIRIACQHVPGNIQPVVKGVVSEQLTPEAQATKDFDESVDKEYPTSPF